MLKMEGYVSTNTKCTNPIGISIKLANKEIKVTLSKVAKAAVNMKNKL